MLKLLQRRERSDGNYLNFTELILYVAGQAMLSREPVDERSKTYTLNMSGKDKSESTVCRWRYMSGELSQQTVSSPPTHFRGTRRPTRFGRRPRPIPCMDRLAFEAYKQDRTSGIDSGRFFQARLGRNHSPEAFRQHVCVTRQHTIQSAGANHDWHSVRARRNPSWE